MIGVVTTSYPRHSEDPAGSFVRERVRVLRATGASVQVLAAGAGPDCGDPGVSVLRIPAADRDGWDLFGGAGAPDLLERHGPAAWLAGIHAFSRLVSAVGQHAPSWTAVESHWLVPSALIVAARAHALPHRAHAHGGDVSLLERLPCGRSVARWLARSGVTMVFASADLADRFAGLAGCERRRLQVEAAPFDPAPFVARPAADRAALRRRLGLQDGAPIVLAAGRLVPVKGFDILVRAVARIPRPRRPRLVVLGEGPERPRLEALAASRGISLLLPGTVPRTQVGTWMSAADLYVQPSRVLANGRSEGMPLSVREALACGLPVVACASGGLRELGASIHLVPPEDPQALMEAMVLHVGYS